MTAQQSNPDAEPARVPPFDEQLQRAEQQRDAARRMVARLEREVARLHEHLAVLDAKNKSAVARLAHELRGPLSVILPPVEALLRNATLEDRARRMLLVMERNARAVLRTVEGLGEIVRLECRLMPKHEHVDLASLVRDVATHFAPAAEQGRVGWTLNAPERLEAELDPGATLLLIASLFAAAIESTPPHGEAHCQLETALSSSHHPRAVLTVVVSGSGLEAPPTASDLVERLQGSLTAESTPDGRSLLRVTLPIAAPSGDVLAGYAAAERHVAPALPDAISERDEAPPDPDSPVVLVVDDDPDLRQLLYTLLQREYRVVLASNGAEALERATTMVPDVVVTDAMMPKMGGEELFHAMRANALLALTPVLLLTASADDELRLRVLRHGVDDFVLKPFNPQELRVRIGNLAARSRAHVHQHQRRTQETVARMAGQVAHEVNNSLQTIFGLSGLTLASLSESDPLRADVIALKEAAEQAAGLTRELLALGGWQVLRPSAIVVDDFVNAFAHAARRALGPSHEIVVRTSGDRLAVMGDRAQLDRAVMSLVRNSCEAMPSGGRVTLQTGVLDLAEPRSLRDCPDPMPAGGYAVVAVRDDGEGMSREVLRRAFEPFFTTRSRALSRGMGLSTAYSIVRQSGGFIAAHSELGAGSTFTVYLPLAEREESASSRTPTSPQPLPKPGGLRILLVEDDRVVRALAERILRISGHHPRTATSGEEALDDLARAPDIDLLVTDVMLPGMSGGELAAEARRLRPGLRVLFVSGYPQDDLVMRGLLARGAAFLAKPFTPDALASAVCEAAAMRG